MGKVGFIPVDMENLRLHYSMTLDWWARRFEENLDKIRALSGNNGGIVYDEPFIRMWRFYLNACLLGLRYGTDRLYQTTFTNGINNTYPITRDYLYVEPRASIEARPVVERRGPIPHVVPTVS